MRLFRNNSLPTTTAFAMASLPLATHQAAATTPAVSSDYEHVLLISVDGMHAVDLAKWIEKKPDSYFAKLANTGIVYPNTFTTATSDSFPA